MSDTSDTPAPRRSEKPAGDAAATDPREVRRRRQAEALRANLRRRKEVARTAGETAGASGKDTPGNSGDGGR